MAEKQLTSILSFFIKDELFAFDTDFVRNILELSKITRVPNTKEFFEGVINLHGNIIPVVDLRKIMGVDELRASKDTVVIVLSGNDHADSMIGLIVDGVKEVFSLNEDYALQDAIIDNSSNTLIKINYKGTLKLQSDFIHIIDQNDLMEEIEK